MSFGDEQEPTAADYAGQVTLTHANLVDLRMACERALRAIPETILAFRGNDPEGMLGALGDIVSGLECIKSELRLEDFDDDDGGTVASIERITRNGGRADG